MADFRISGDRLAIRGDLDEDAEFEMRDRCRELLESGAETVTVDLTKVEKIRSMCIGMLVALWIDLREAGRRGKIIPSESVTRLLEMTGLAEVLLRPPSAREKAASGDEKPDDEKPDDKRPDDKKPDDKSTHDGAKKAKF